MALVADGRCGPGAAVPGGGPDRQLRAGTTLPGAKLGRLLWAGSEEARRGSRTTACRASASRLKTLARLCERGGAKVV